METAAFLGLLGLGYMASTRFQKEGFTDATNDRTPTGKPTVPGKPRQPTPSSTGEYDIQFQLPAGGTLPIEPNPSDMQGKPTEYSTRRSNFVPKQSDNTLGGKLQLRPDSREDATPRKGLVSDLTGIEFKPGEFKHANMVPFFRGQVKQNTMDTANTQVLDSFTGSGKALYAKREQTPFFEPSKEPVGNPYGMESTTDFMESRYVESRNRTNERPVEPIRVGPGLNEGFTHLPSGGFQQQSGEEYMISRIPRTNDMRVATNPKLSYAQPVVQGAHFITTSGTAESVGEVRKYTPDRFYLNSNGERNFVTAGADTKPAVRSTQVLKHVTRPDTSKPYEGVAGQTEGKATYTVGSTRTPLVKQMGTWGYRNANMTDTFNSNTDASQNDYGKSGVEILPNERYYTGERVHGTNVVPDQREVELPLQDHARATRQEETVDNPRPAGNFTALGNVAEKPTLYDPNDPLRTTIKETTIDNDWIGMVAPTDAQPRLTVYDPNDPLRTTIKETTVDNDWIGMAAPTEAQPRLTVYDPNDILRTTIRETTEDNEWKGIAAPADVAQKLTVYDPDDVARVTGRNTLKDWDRYRNVGRSGLPENAEIRIQDGVRPTQKASISGKSAYSGTAYSARAEKDRQDAQAMRHYAQKEQVARGRKPTNSSTKIFNGEDNITLQYRRVVADSINDRQPGMDRVNNEPTSSEVIGLQRPRAVLKMDISSVRNEPVVVSSLEANPYVIPLHKVAAVGGKNAI